MTMIKKRKAGAMPKFYAVRAGKTPGVYATWLECKDQIDGFKGALYKSFETREDAAAFVAGQKPPSELAAQGNIKQPDRFYAVAKGRKPGIYTDWDTAQTEAIMGTKGPKYKKFGTRREAEDFILRNGSLETIKSLGLLRADDGDDADAPDDEDEEAPAPAGKKMKIADGGGAQPAGFYDGWHNVYTDGASRFNGSPRAKAGVGVFFGPGDSRNISERLEGSPQTNQRAELTAVLRALEVVPIKENIRIWTDSNYSIQCVTLWYKTWESNGWKNAKGNAVENQDLIKAIRKRMEKRAGRGGQTECRWIKGHGSNPGNVAADTLAVQGAMIPRPGDLP